MPGRALVAAAFVLLAMGVPPPASAQWVHRYQMIFPPAPATFAQATGPTFAARRNAIVNMVACGLEGEFSKQLFVNGQDLTTILIGKLERFYQMTALGGLPPGEAVCTQTRRYERDDPFDAGSFDRVATLNDTYPELFGPECRNPVLGLTESPGVKQVTFRLSAACLRRQINVVISRLAAGGQMGTAGAPCDPGLAPLEFVRWLFSSSSEFKILSEGDYDMPIRDLLRLYHLDKARGHAVLDPPQRRHLTEDLITVGFGPVEESYPVFACGNQEHVTGSPSERADEEDFIDRALDKIGDLFKWLKRRWFLVLVFVGFITFAVYLAPSPGAAAAIVGASVAVFAGEEALFRIPETENHLLMIQTSRYLNNQLILDSPEMQSHPNRARIEQHQRETREWLLRRMQSILKQDFREYNSRPYHAFSIQALMNLYDFASVDDPAVKLAARCVLDFATAKGALGSNRSRRIVPFRRLGGETQNTGIFDLLSGADHQIALVLLYAGQTQALPGTASPDPPGVKVDLGAAGNLVFAATSGYRPDPIVLDIAMDKSEPYWQTIHHAGIELYYSTPAFLMSAGGIQTDAADTVLGIGRDVDRGVAVPTVLIPTAHRGNLSRNDFLRIEGGFHMFGKDGSKEVVSYDHNGCLYEGFACGLNVVVPGDHEVGPSDPANHGNEPYKNCLEPGPPGSSPNWKFINSARCGDVFKPGPDFFVAVYRMPCPAGTQDLQCRRNAGFFEAVFAPNPSDIAFAAFKAKVVAKNPSVFLAATPTLGIYRTFADPGHKIQFDLVRHQKASDEWPILVIDDLPVPGGYDIDNWPLAKGDVLTATGDGVVTVKKPGYPQSIRLDLGDWANPKRTP